MEKELKYLKGAVDSPVRPMACIVGGAKVSSKVLGFKFVSRSDKKLACPGPRVGSIGLFSCSPIHGTSSHAVATTGARVGTGTRRPLLLVMASS